MIIYIGSGEDYCPTLDENLGDEAFVYIPVDEPEILVKGEYLVEQTDNSVSTA